MSPLDKLPGRSNPSAPAQTAIETLSSLDATAGVMIGTYGLAELEPIPLGYTALIIGYALVCSLVVNDFVKVALIADYQNTTTPALDR